MAALADFPGQPEHDQSASEKEKLPERQCQQHHECRQTHAHAPLLSFRDSGAENPFRTVAGIKKVQTVAKTPQPRRRL
jgi:hypothetical protein